jgi:RHS repeat-associated protein
LSRKSNSITSPKGCSKVFFPTEITIEAPEGTIYNYYEKTLLSSHFHFTFCRHNRRTAGNIWLHYYANGHLAEIKLNGQTSIWKLNTENDMGLPTKATTGSITRYYEYDDYGLPLRRRAEAQENLFQDYFYNFNEQTGNLNLRGNYRTTERFDYDTMNRLTGVRCQKSDSRFDPPVEYTVSYDAKGNITAHSQTGAFGYNHPDKPYALTDVGLYGNYIPLRNQTVTYTSSMRPATISENGYEAQFTYNAAGDRVRMRILHNDIAELTRYYIDNYEQDVTTSSTTERLYLGGNAYSAPAVYVNENNTWNIYYICRDYQGSITHVADASGTVVQETEYDAWGRLRHPYTRMVYTPGNEPDLLLGRGYTGHEHLPQFGLINMNARLYDPALGRFLSPDPYVQIPDFTQNYNRYSYCLNNPLKYTDPDGEFWHLIIGAAIGGVVNWATHGFRFDAKGLGYFGVGALAGALGAGVGAGISSALAGGSFGAGFMGTQAAMTAASSFVSGAAIGGGAGFASSFTTGFGNDLMKGNSFGHALGQGGIQGLIGGASGALIGGIAGGIDAVRDNRTFWRGGTVVKEPLAYDYSFDGIPLNEQTGNYGCVDNALDNVSVSEGYDVCGSDVRYALDPKSSPLTDGLNDAQAVGRYGKMIGGQTTGFENINRGTMNDLYHSIGTDKVLVSYPKGDMYHMVNVQGAYRQIITYPSGSTSTKIMYYVLDNGKQLIRSASYFRGGSFFRIILP